MKGVVILGLNVLWYDWKLFEVGKWVCKQTGEGVDSFHSLSNRLFAVQFESLEQENTWLATIMAFAFDSMEDPSRIGFREKVGLCCKWLTDIRLMIRPLRADLNKVFSVFEDTNKIDEFTEEDCISSVKERMGEYAADIYRDIDIRFEGESIDRLTGRKLATQALVNVLQTLGLDDDVDLVNKKLAQAVLSIAQVMRYKDGTEQIDIVARDYLRTVVFPDIAQVFGEGAEKTEPVELTEPSVTYVYVPERSLTVEGTFCEVVPEGIETGGNENTVLGERWECKVQEEDTHLALSVKIWGINPEILSSDSVFVITLAWGKAYRVELQGKCYVAGPDFSSFVECKVLKAGPFGDLIAKHFVY